MIRPLVSWRGRALALMLAMVASPTLSGAQIPSAVPKVPIDPNAFAGVPKTPSASAKASADGTKWLVEIPGIAIDPKFNACLLGLPWRADYYNNSSEPKGNVVASECFGELKRNYADKAAGGGGPPPKPTKKEAFSARYYGNFAVSQGGLFEATYKFKGKAVVRIDNIPVAILFGGTAESAYSGNKKPNEGTFKVDIQAGKRLVTIDYFGIETPGAAEFSMKLVDPDCGSGPKAAWKASYFKLGDLSGTPVLKECVSKVSFDLTKPTLVPPALASNAYMSARWEKSVPPTKAGDAVRFDLAAYGKVKLFVGGAETLNIAPVTGGKTKTANVLFDSKAAKSVKIEVRDKLMKASVNLAETFCSHDALAVTLDGPPYKSPNWMALTAKAATYANVLCLAKTKVEFVGVKAETCAGKALCEASVPNIPRTSQIVVRGTAIPNVGAEVVKEKTIQLKTCAEDGSKWEAAFYDNKSLSGAPKVLVCDSGAAPGYKGLSFDWSPESGTVEPRPGIGTDNWSASWWRRVGVESGKMLAFKVKADDGARIYVNGKPILDLWNWVGDAFAEFLPTKTETVDIEFQYRQFGGKAYFTVEEAPCVPNGVKAFSLKTIPGFGNTRPFFAEATAPNCMGAIRREIWIDGNLAETCDGGGDKCEQVSWKGYPGKTSVPVVAKLIPFSGAVQQLSTTYTFDSCNDGIKNNGETGIDCGGPCKSKCADCFADSKNGDGSAAKYFSFGSPVVNEKAGDALDEFLNHLKNDGKVAADVGTLGYYFTGTKGEQADRIMEAVSWYVSEHMTYLADDCDDWGEAPAEKTILESSKRPYCPGNKGDKTSGAAAGGAAGAGGKTCPAPDWCGDCEDHAFLRFALARAHGIGRQCSWVADSHMGYDQGQSSCPDLGGKKPGAGGHTFNIVYYQGKYRILDYGGLPDQLYDKGMAKNCWFFHSVDNIYDDVNGAWWDSAEKQSKKRMNYPGQADKDKCGGSGWNWKSYYIDVCP